MAMFKIKLNVKKELCNLVPHRSFFHVGIRTSGKNEIKYRWSFCYY